MGVSPLEYDFLIGSWRDPKGAAYNATYEFCREEGWCDIYGNPTELGKLQCKKYEEKYLLTKPF